MASFLHIERVNALPSTLAASTMYVVKSSEAGLAEVYFTNNDGTEARHVINKTEIQAMVTSSIAGFNNIQVISDIAARDAMTPDRNLLGLVLDASGDATVNAGAALYVYNTVDTTWTKVSEFESLDVVLEWSAIQGRPSSSVADIDDAVARKHSHTNLDLLEKVGEDVDGKFTYNGAYVEAYLTSAQW